MYSEKLKTAVRVILPTWLVIKLIAALVTFFSMSAVDLTFVNPAVELGFQSLVFTRESSVGLALFIVFVVITAIGYPASYLVIPDNRTQNIVGFFAYAVILLTDIVSGVILGFSDGIFFLALIPCLPMVLCLLYYGKTVLLSPKTEEEEEDGEEENNP